ncbi:hypothetical protein ACFYP2_16495 [Bacillus velezensis]|uniref:hypothetical protein n=1 Tax=Bacillus amyloliquefaciens group TaxID=1938374 RepID=UPI001C9DE985|nr:MULTISPECIES: hypothetical protein [Bacillus amyloliquefaciens group]QZT40919.1 hypothetical protein BAJP3042_19300 [Bacillus amyloliquefaciens]
MNDSFFFGVGEIVINDTLLTTLLSNQKHNAQLQQSCFNKYGVGFGGIETILCLSLKH